MNAAVLAGIAFVAFALGYRFYSKFLGQRIFALGADELVPAQELEDGIDYVPTRTSVLWGHHFASIAGAAPIVGPAIAVIWGWAPALVWVCLGTIFMGATHDFAALVISARHRGRSMGEIAGDVISPRVKALFLLIISLLVWVVLAVFAYIIATLFVSTPSSIFPINVQIAVAMTIGWLIYRRRIPILIPSLVGYAVLLVAIFYGESFVELFPAIREIPVLTWVWVLLLYSFVASVLPVWLLLQPRDYLNSHQLVTGLVLLVAGLIVLQPVVVAPAINPSPEGAPPLFPFLFVTIACGAVLAVTAGFATSEEWWQHYSSWGAANGLAAKLDAFVSGGARFVGSLGVPIATAKTLMAVIVIAFAATSLDTGARIQRLVIAELAGSYGIKRLTNRFLASAVGIGAALMLAVTQGGGTGGLALWPLFGTTNQLVASVTLLVVSIWLQRRGRPVVYTLLPMLAVGAVTAWAMLGNLTDYYSEFGDLWLLALSGTLILALDLWIMLEGLTMLFGERGRVPRAAADAPF